MMNIGNNNASMPPNHLRALDWKDQSYTNLINSINQGFPPKCSLTEPDIRDFFEVWEPT